LVELRRSVADLVPAGLVRDLLVKARLELEVAHQSCGDEVLLAEVVIEAGSAVAAEVAGRELTLVALGQGLALGELEVLRGDHDPSKARARPPLAASAMAVAQCLGILNLILDATTQASSLERFSHDDLLQLASGDPPGTLPPAGQRSAIPQV